MRVLDAYAIALSCPTRPCDSTAPIAYFEASVVNGAVIERNTSEL